MTYSAEKRQIGPDSPRVKALRDKIIAELDDRIGDTLSRLPMEYFQQIPPGNRVTVISHQNHPGLLARLIRGLPREKPLVGAKIFTSLDKDFIVDVFEFQDAGGKKLAVSDSKELSGLVEKVQQLTGATAEEVSTFVERYDSRNVILDSLLIRRVRSPCPPPAAPRATSSNVLQNSSAARKSIFIVPFAKTWSFAKRPMWLC